MLYEITYDVQTKQSTVVLAVKERFAEGRLNEVKELSSGRFSCVLQAESLENAASEAKKIFADYFEKKISNAIDAAIASQPIPIGYRAQIDFVPVDFAPDFDFRDGLKCNKFFVEPLYDAPEYGKDIKPSIVKIDDERAVFVFPNDLWTKNHDNPEHAARNFFCNFLIATYGNSRESMTTK